MISAEKLLSYLPWYYQESRVMRSIMEAIAPELPDAIGHLWKTFYLHLVKDDEELLKYYQEELQAYDLAALFGKLRSSGVLNRELLAGQGIEAVDTHIFSPESGYVLSGETSVFPDGIYYAPLIVDLQVNPDLINIARQLVAEAGTAGMRYWFSVLTRETFQADLPQAILGVSISPGIILSVPDEVLSGSKIYRNSALMIHYQTRFPVPQIYSTTAPAIVYNGLLLKFTELGALDILQNVDDIQLEDKTFSEDEDAAELIAHIFKTGPPDISAANWIWYGYSFKASAAESASEKQCAINITPAARYLRNEWSPAVSFLEPGVTFLDENIFAQWGNVKVEVG